MNTTWQSFLEQSGANIVDNTVRDFGDPDNELNSNQQTIIADLSHYGIIAVEGDDAADFLQNQLSNDIKLVDDTHSQLSSYCSPKGRMLASLRVFRFNNKYLIRLPADTLEATLKRLRMFILRSQVILEDISNDLARFGLHGDNAVQLLSDAGITAPEDINNVSQKDGVCVIRIPGTRPRFEVYGQPEVLAELWKSFAKQGKTVGAGVWALQDIEAGIPDVFSGTVEAFVPQMTNLHAIDGISFKKGCYPGQEVVARMQYLGKLKRRMYRAYSDTGTLPSAGDNLFSSGSDESVGKVVQAQPSPRGGIELLAVLQIAQAEQESIHLQGKNGPQLEFIDLPYEVPLEREK
ncbi:MAG: folate-binding protein [Gammaproteobacteria bacterium]|jgi:folate-binding protein YgfZ